MNPFVASLIRTIVPLLVGSAISWLVSMGIDIDESGVAYLSSFLTALFGGLYYVAVRYLEEKVPAFGWLLGLAQTPDSYTRPQKNGRHEA